MADIEASVCKQIEFYFSDSNFPKDYFLRALASKNEEGFVPIDTFLTFPRVQKLTTDLEIITKAIKASPLLVVDDAGKMVRRKEPLPVADTSGPRTIHSRGWPTPYTIEEVTSLYSKHGEVKSVRIKRKFESKDQKDSCFVEFATEAEAKEALTAGPLKFKDCTIESKSKEQYWMDKKNKRKEKRKGNAEKEGTEKKGPKEYTKKQKSEKSEKEEAESDAPNPANNPKEWKKGLIIHFNNIGDDQTRETLREIFEAYGAIHYVDFSKGKSNGHIRFTNPEGAAKALKEMQENKREIGGKLPELKLLAGDEEDAYLKQVLEGQTKKKNEIQQKKKFKKKKKRF